MGLKQYFRHSAKVTRSRRWKSLRLEALRRDRFSCVKCGARGGLEVDHIKPVRDRPDLSFDLDNLQTLCGKHHSQKTRIEVGFPVLCEARQKWRDLVSGDCPSPKTSNQKGI